MITHRTSDDPERRAYLNSLPPGERSEAAAIYDRRNSQPLQPSDLMDRARESVLQKLVLDAIESGEIAYQPGYILPRLSRGCLPPHVRTSIDRLAASITDTDVAAEAERLATVINDRDRHYLRVRYGIQVAW